ncbi:unnamed protein product [Blepharisma stoltei]|uniref:Serine/threonine-protein kinase PLK n=1 Tax=Blepharisma stoltei TaxID=1481888 RepID=A0AAU9K6T0_9CILI|nr:unnamed protein product [Blepharisma stoltei]
MSIAARTTASSLQESGSLEAIIEEKIVNPKGSVSIKRYSKGRFLGKGGFARVYEIQDLESKKIHAAKVIPKANLTKARTRQKLMSEIKIHRGLKHPNIVGFEHFFEDHENVYILLELCINQTLNELLRRRKRLSELEVMVYMTQTLSAIEYLHDHRVIHRDLKLGNMFLNEKLEIKLGDFGLASKLEYDGQKRRTICGTPNYIAPEILEGRDGHSYEVDVWSFGVILYTLLIGKPPFETNDVKMTYKKIRSCAYSFPDHVAISAQAKDLIEKLLQSDPESRLSIQDIYKHSFFNMGFEIPKFLPPSTLAIPPSESFLKQYQQKPKMPPYKPSHDTAPVNQERQPLTHRNPSNTQRPSSSSSHKTPSISSLSGEIKTPFVNSWVDYSSKYGLGYTLSTGSVGVYFNDATKIILDPTTQAFRYICRDGEKKDVTNWHTLTDYPQTLQKKVTLLHHFRSYLDSDKENPVYYQSDESPYVKKWMRTRRAILFRMSNKVVQVVFQDHSELIISTQVLTYVNKSGVKKSMPLSQASECGDLDLCKRIKYTKDILNHMNDGKQIDYE